MKRKEDREHRPETAVGVLVAAKTMEQWEIVKLRQ